MFLTMLLLDRLESFQVINALDLLYPKPEKLSFHSSGKGFTVYKKNKVVRLDIESTNRILEANHHLQEMGQSPYEILAKYIIRKLHRKKDFFPEIMNPQKVANEVL